MLKSTEMTACATLSFSPQERSAGTGDFLPEKKIFILQFCIFLSQNAFTCGQIRSVEYIF